jgi:hypothetical protein
VAEDSRLLIQLCILLLKYVAMAVLCWSVIGNKEVSTDREQNPVTYQQNPHYGTDPPVDAAGGPLREKNEWKICRVQ